MSKNDGCQGSPHSPDRCRALGGGWFDSVGDQQLRVASALLEETTENLLRELATARKRYGTDVLTLTVTCRCLENLIQNAEVVRYLKTNHLEILDALQHLVRQVDAERVATQ